jgi:hypothetical protein
MKFLPRRKIYTILGAGVAVILLIMMCMALVRTPSLKRDWSVDQAIMPEVIFNGDMVTINNIRNFSYTSTSEYVPAYYSKTFDIRTLSSIEYVVEELATVAVAHTFLIFGFENGDKVAVSVEIRKEKGEVFSPIKGLVDEYELMYVIVDERDTLVLRALHRDNPVHMYEVTTTPERRRALFSSMVTRAKSLSEKPEFYNTITSTCTTNIVSHINALVSDRVPFDPRILMPKNSDRFAYELKLLDTSLPFEELKKRSYKSDLIKLYANDPLFSKKIRAEGGGEIRSQDFSSQAPR